MRDHVMTHVDVRRTVNMTASVALRQSTIASLKPRRCFIAAPAGLDLGPLATELRNRGLATPDTVSSLDDTLDSGTLSRGIADADLVVAVISSTGPEPNVLIELGMALGADRPILLLIDPEADLPWILRGTHSVRATPTDVGAIRFHLDVFLEKLEELAETDDVRPVRRTHRPSREALMRADERISAWERSNHPPSEHDVVDLLVGLFQSGEYVVVRKTDEQPASLGKSGADLAVWIDDLQDWGVNPLLVAVVSGDTAGRDAAGQLKERVHEAQSYLGLIVAWEDGVSRQVSAIATAPWPLVALMSVRGVVDSLRRGQFAAEIANFLARALHLGSQADG